MAQRVSGSIEQDIADISSALSEIRDLLDDLPNREDYFAAHAPENIPEWFDRIAGETLEDTWVRWCWHWAKMMTEHK